MNFESLCNWGLKYESQHNLVCKIFPQLCGSVKKTIFLLFLDSQGLFSEISNFNYLTWHKPCSISTTARQTCHSDVQILFSWSLCINFNDSFSCVGVRNCTSTPESSISVSELFCGVLRDCTQKMTCDDEQSNIFANSNLFVDSKIYWLLQNRPKIFISTHATPCHF